MDNSVDSVIEYKKGTDTQLSTHFTSREFDCPCSDCTKTLIDKELVSHLEAVRTSLGSVLHITSGYRCSSYQAQLKLRGYETASGISQHTLGKAADVSNGVMTGMELEGYARKVGFRAVGVGNHWIHVDMRSDKDRRWAYKS